MTENPGIAFDSLLLQGFAQLEEGRFEEAIETFSTCHALDGNDDRPLRGRGLGRFRLDQFADAEKDFRAARDLKESEPENWMGLGLSLAMQNKIYEALEIYENLLTRKPDFVPGHIQMGYLQLKIGAITKGQDYFKKALTLRPSLEQRKTIEGVLKEQKRLDAKRLYRPDFDRLRKQNGTTPLVESIRKFFGLKKKANPAQNDAVGFGE